jgi:hypothetical protein
MNTNVTVCINTKSNSSKFDRTWKNLSHSKQFKNIKLRSTKYLIVRDFLNNLLRMEKIKGTKLMARRSYSVQKIKSTKPSLLKSDGLDSF